MATALISLGSNLGYREATLSAAVQKLRRTPCIEQVVVSSYHATKPVGGPEGQEEFLNAAARLDTPLSPRALLTQLQRIEHELGRIRQEHWGPRTIDLDLLLYDDQVINEPELIVPHRFLPFRRFVLEPANEVARELLHPILNWTMERMLQHACTAPNKFLVRGDSQSLVDVLVRRLTEEGVEMTAEQPKAVFCIGQELSTTTVPALLLPADDLDRAAGEAVAAIQAMQ